MRRLTFALLVVFLSPHVVLARGVVPRWDVGDVSADYVYDSLRVRLTLEFIDQEVPSGKAVSFSPFLRVGGKDYPMPSVVIYSERRPPEAPVTGSRDEVVVRSGQFATPLGVSCRFGDVPDDRDTLDLYVTVSRWGPRGYREGSRSRLVARITRPPRPDASVPCGYVPSPLDGEGRRRTLSVRPEWRLGSSRLDLRLGQNDSLWSSVRGALADVASCPYVSVRSVLVECGTDVTGPERVNRSVSAARASAAAAMLRRAGVFPDGVSVSSSGLGEDWEGFLSWASSSFWGRDSSVTAVLSSRPADAAEKTLRASFPEFWRSASVHCFPGLRRLTFVVACSPASFPSSSDVIRAVSDYPWCVGASDLMALSKSGELDAAAMAGCWKSVALARPDDPFIQCDAASALIGVGDVREALRFLSRCPAGFARADYLRAACASLMGDWAGAYEMLKALSASDPGLATVADGARRMALWVAGAGRWNVSVYKAFIPLS